MSYFDDENTYSGLRHVAVAIDGLTKHLQGAGDLNTRPTRTRDCGGLDYNCKCDIHFYMEDISKVKFCPGCGNKIVISTSDKLYL